MKRMVPALSPLLRSNTQGEMLATLYLDPQREFSVSELARRANVSQPTMFHETKRLLAMGFLKDRKDGRNRIVRVNGEHPLHDAVREIVLYSYGPLAILPEVLSKVSGIEDAFIFGSWAERYEGIEGHEPEDIDVVVIGTPTRSALAEAASEASSVVRREVNIIPVTSRDWDTAQDVFTKTIKERVLIRVPLASGRSY